MNGKELVAAREKEGILESARQRNGRRFNRESGDVSREKKGERKRPLEREREREEGESYRTRKGVNGKQMDKCIKRQIQTADKG